jgi:dinuclear metal center YbgI/SA1388 family protein
MPGMAPLREVVAALDEELAIVEFEDYGPNGLQGPGPVEVGTVVTGVSAQAELFERAAEAGADLVLVHHGLVWDGSPRQLDAAAKRRLKLLFDHDIALAAYHLPLDAHPRLGNNAIICERLGLAGREPFGLHRGRPIGWAGRLPGGGVPIGELVARVEALAGRAPLVFDAGPRQVRSLGVVSGAAADSLAEAIDRGFDAFLTGEPAERVMAQAREAGVHFIAAGHYATETFGVRALGDLTAERFGLRHVFADVPNPI